ncbi:hypothetical protein M0R45_004583 [Rubus argutus]|uniref:Uncharacterized protein n=1 Tax=Rubus argutus TaxID=59490 RepID=A0AAW1YK48_RUBAR
MAVTRKEMDRMDRIKGPWSPEEDDALQNLVHKHGPRNWSLISKAIPGRSGKSCRLRWCNQLSPQVEHRAFTPEEDDNHHQSPRPLRQQSDDGNGNGVLMGGGYDGNFHDQPPLKRSVSAGSGVPVSTELFMNPGSPVRVGCERLQRAVDSCEVSNRVATESTQAPGPAPVRDPMSNFPAELLELMQGMIKKEVRSYMEGLEQSGVCVMKQQNDGFRNVAVKRIGISRIE